MRASAMWMPCFATFFAVTVWFAAMPWAEAADTNRFSWVETDDGLMRLDQETGTISLCARSVDGWRCAPVVDEVQPEQARIAELEAEIGALRAEVARLEADAGVAGTSGNTTGQANGLVLPDEEEVDEAFKFLEGTLKRFKGLMEQLEDPKGEGTPL